ncbi:hypothetical protein PENTCL1PPCAC_12473, partial [Pristionchus entomophagus]
MLNDNSTIIKIGSFNHHLINHSIYRIPHSPLNLPYSSRSGIVSSPSYAHTTTRSPLILLRCVSLSGRGGRRGRTDEKERRSFTVRTYTLSSGTSSDVSASERITRTEK